MSGGIKCCCDNPKWKVLQYKCKYSAFHSPRTLYRDSKDSLIYCGNCEATWRTKAKYVDRLLLEKTVK